MVPNIEDSAGRSLGIPTKTFSGARDEKNHSGEDLTGARQFDYPGGITYWWRYLPVGIGLAFVYAILVLNGLQPFSGFLFPALVAIVLLDMIGTGVMRYRSPHAFRTDGEALLIEWSDATVAVSLDRVSVRRGLTRLLNSGTVLRAANRTFAVFEDLRGYGDLMSLCAKSVSSDDP